VIRVLFFASLREAVGYSEVGIPPNPDNPHGFSLDGLMSALRGRLEAAAYAALVAENVRIAVNRELVEGNVDLRAGDEVAFLPPVTGG